MNKQHDVPNLKFFVKEMFISKKWDHAMLGYINAYNLNQKLLPFLLLIYETPLDKIYILSPL